MVYWLHRNNIINHIQFPSHQESTGRGDPLLHLRNEQGSISKVRVPRERREADICQGRGNLYGN